MTDQRPQCHCGTTASFITRASTYLHLRDLGLCDANYAFICHHYLWPTFNLCAAKMRAAYELHLTGSRYAAPVANALVQAPLSVDEWDKTGNLPKSNPTFTSGQLCHATYI